MEEADKFITDKWRLSAIGNKQEQEEAKLELEGMKRLNMMVTGFINIGTVAAKQLEEIEKLEKK